MVSPAIHYLGVVGTAANSDHARCAAQWERIKAERADEYGPDGAYNFGACIHGTTYIGRGWGRDSAANGQQAGVNYNPGSRALCALVGTDDIWTPELEQACADFANEAFARGYPKPLKSHSDFVATGCCGDNGRAFIRRFNAGEIREEVEEEEDMISYITKRSQPDVGIWATNGMHRRHIGPDEWGFVQLIATIEKKPVPVVVPLTDQWWNSLPVAE
jgi:hypothetical protein